MAAERVLHADTYVDYERMILVVSRVTDMDRALRPRGVMWMLMLRSAVSARRSASSSICCALRYLFIVIVTTSSCDTTTDRTIPTVKVLQDARKRHTPNSSVWLEAFPTSRFKLEKRQVTDNGKGI